MNDRKYEPNEAGDLFENIAKSICSSCRHYKSPWCRLVSGDCKSTESALEFSRQLLREGREPIKFRKTITKKWMEENNMSTAVSGEGLFEWFNDNFGNSAQVVDVIPAILKDKEAEDSWADWLIDMLTRWEDWADFACQADVWYQGKAYCGKCVGCLTSKRRLKLPDEYMNMYDFIRKAGDSEAYRHVFKTLWGVEAGDE